MFPQIFSNRKLLVDVFALLFGIGAWIGINGIYVELPILVNSAPEGWNLPVYMVVVVQFANLGPILYSLYLKVASGSKEHYLIYGVLGLGTTSVYLLSLLHNKTSIILGEEHSTYLLGLVFFSSLVGCTSSVLFMPYMRHYREIYLVTFMVGEGLSGFLPSLGALVQGVGGNPSCVNATQPTSTEPKLVPYYPSPRFSSGLYFVVIGTVMLLSLLSFLGLERLPVARSERVKQPSSTSAMEMTPPPSYQTDSFFMPRTTYASLLVAMTLICVLGNGMMPSIQSYSCLPYGNLTYHLTVTLATMASPLGMSLNFVFSKCKPQLLLLMTGLKLLVFALVFWQALQSPEPPLRDSWLGTIVLVLLWTLLNGLNGFVKVAIITLFRQDPGRGLYYTGVVTQVGSITGAIASFFLVTKSGWFQSYSPCDALVAH